MTRIGFSGFADGETVTVSVTKDGATKGPVTVSAWRQNDNGKLGEIAVSVKREPAGTIAAPEPIRLHAVVTSTTGLPLRQNGDVTPDAMYDYDIFGDGSVVVGWDQQLHELEFEWTIRSGTSGTFDKVSRLPSQWRVRDKISGPYADFMLEEPGDHDVTCEVYRTDYSGGTQTSTLIARKTITIADVLDPDVLYAGTATTVVSSAFPAGQVTSDARSIDSEAPVGSRGVNSINDFLNLVGGPVHRILLKRGETFTVNGTRSGGPSRTWGAYGSSSERPIVQHSADADTDMFTIQRSTIKQSFGYWKFEGIHFQGLWDEKTELEPGNRPFLNPVSPGQLILYDCTAAGVDRLVRAVFVDGQAESGVGEPGESAVWLYDTVLDGFQNYGIHIDGNWMDVILVGGGIKRQPDATMNVPEGKSQTIEPSNLHGPMRVVTLNRIAARATDWFSRSSWSADNTPFAARAQPCWRVGTHNDTSRAPHPVYGVEGYGFWTLQVHNSVFESGSTCISLSTENDGNPILPANSLIKHNLFIFDISSAVALGLPRGGTSVIENVLVAPAVASASYHQDEYYLDPDQTRNGFWGWYDNGVTPPEINYAWPWIMCGNLVIDDKTPLNAEDELGFNSPLSDPNRAYRGFTGLVITRDNHVFGPNYSTPETAIGSLEAAFTVASYNTYGARYRRTYEPDPANWVYDVWTPTDPGEANTNWRGSTHQGLPLVTPNGEVTVRRPATGDAAIGGATGAMSRLDLLGTPRPAAAALTPLEPAS